MGKQTEPTRHDIGAAMMAWYAEALKRHPAGLVSQAQAAAMLAVSRMSISRLVARGYLRAVYFPRPPDIAGVAVGQGDPGWLRLAAWLGLDPTEADVRGFPKACYVAFADVVKLWRSGQVGQECSRDWAAILAELGAAPPPRGGEEPASEAGAPAESEPAAPAEELETWML
jgi:predicted DNA-binding transcriptional regulator AlpA